jgi:LysM repeat protein
MKRLFVPLTIFLFALAAVGQDTTPQSPAAEVAAKQSADERYDRMSADIQALQAANEALQQKLNVLMQQLQDLHSQLAQAPSNLATTDDLKRLAEKIVEVDRKREEDKGAISEEIRKSISDLKHALAESAPPARVSAPRPVTPAEPAENDKGFVYKVQEGDSLSAIVKAYNADFKSKGMKTITLKQAMDANPSVNWGRLLVGQKIVIPQPPQ